ncbi:hypothetical protein A2U01_0116184, partial [Trifolium medium]|nr:hypothetical protein [Trifolium medium]
GERKPAGIREFLASARESQLACWKAGWASTACS